MNNIPLNTNSAHAENYHYHLQEYKRIKLGEMAVINQKSIWLFVATLSCWSVEVRPFRALVLFITILCFFYELYCILNEEAHARKRKTVTALDEAAKNDPEKVKEVEMVKKQFVGIKSTFRHCWLYVISFVFVWGFSIIYTIERLR